MKTMRLDNEGMSQRILRGGAALVLGSALAACGGGGGSSSGSTPDIGGDKGGGDATGAFNTPEDALLHAAALILMEARPSASTGLILPVCEDGGSLATDSMTVPTPYSSADLDGTRLTYDECVNGGTMLDGRVETAADSDGSITYSGFGDESGAFTRTHRDTGAVEHYNGESQVCGDACNLVNGVLVWDMRSHLSLEVRNGEGQVMLALQRGTDEQPFRQSWRDDYPAAGQTLFWVQGSLAYQANDGACRLNRASYTIPESARFLVLTADGTDYPTESGLVRIELNDTVADAEYAPGGITLTVDGASETFTWDQVREAYAGAGCSLLEE